MPSPHAPSAHPGRHVTLLRPPAISTRFTYTIGVVLPLGPAYIAAALLEAGHRVAVIDALGEAPLERGTTAQPNLIYHGLSIAEIVERIDPATDALGISVMFSQQWPHVEDIIRAIHARFPDLPIFIGGEHVAGAWEFVLDNCPAVTACAIGEGEETMVELVEYVAGRRDLADVNGIACRIDGRPQRTPPRPRIRNLDEIPRPAWDLFPVDKYHDGGFTYGVNLGRAMPILATRGCPYSCTFCSSPAMWTTRYYVRDVADVVDEIASYVDRYAATNVDFYDLTAIIKRDWILAFCAEIERRGLDITYQLPTGTRSEVLDEEVLRALYRTGCRNICYAPESGSPKTLARIKKKVKPERMLGSIRAANRTGIVVKANLMIGFPDETRGELWETVRFGMKLAWLGVEDLPLFPFIPYPAMELYDSLRAQGRLPEMSNEYFARLGYGDLDSAPVVHPARLESTARVGARDRHAGVPGRRLRAPSAADRADAAGARHRAQHERRRAPSGRHEASPADVDEPSGAWSLRPGRRAYGGEGSRGRRRVGDGSGPARARPGFAAAGGRRGAAASRGRMRSFAGMHRVSALDRARYDALFLAEHYFPNSPWVQSRKEATRLRVAERLREGAPGKVSPFCSNLSGRGEEEIGLGKRRAAGVLDVAQAFEGAPDVVGNGRGLRALGALRRERAVLGAERVEDGARVGIAEIARLPRVGLVGEALDVDPAQLLAGVLRGGLGGEDGLDVGCDIGLELRPAARPRDLDPAAAIPVVDDDLAEQDVPSGVDPDRAAEHDRRPHHHLVVRLAGADRVDEARRTRRRRIGHAEQLKDSRKKSAPDTGPGTVTLAGSTPGSLSSIGVRTTSSLSVRRCPRPPCSKNSSPWSATTTTRVRRAAPAVSSASRIAPSWLSTHATSPS